MFGVCKLCLEEKRLQRSHFLPAFLYRLCREPGAGTNPNPVAVTRKLAVATSEQMTTFLLCRDCERLFHERGEGWVARQVYDGKHFPLLDGLGVALPLIATRQLEIFDGDAVGIDTGKLAYFALSVLWRASIHKWRVVDGQTTSIDLAAYQEPVRTFLLGEAFPSDVVVVTTVCTDEYSQGSFCVPQQTMRSAYSFFARGIAFTIRTGGDMPDEVRELCCFTSMKRPIFVTSREAQLTSALAYLFSTTKSSRGLGRH